MRLGFPQPCFWISTSPAYCSSRRVFDRFLPPTVEQGDHLADGIIQVNPSIFICPAVLAGQVCPPQDKGVQYLCFVGQRRKCGGFKRKLGSRVKLTAFSG